MPFIVRQIIADITTWWEGVSYILSFQVFISIHGYINSTANDFDGFGFFIALNPMVLMLG